MTKKTRINEAYIFLFPYVVLFFTFIVIPVCAAVLLSLTYFNTVQFPEYIGLHNYISLITQDEIFMQHVLPNTIKFGLVVGPGGYALSFILAWALAQITHRPRTILALILYSPSMTAGVAMTVVWRVIFSGDQTGYLNSLLLNAGLTPYSVDPITRISVNQIDCSLCGAVWVWVS